MEALRLKLPVFEGPLDLLLHLINRAQIDIKEIFVSQVTEQYLAYVRQMEEYNMDIASEFIEMAATLLLIKSRSILPTQSDLEEEEDLEQMLIEQLEEYQRFRAAAQALKDRESGKKEVYYKLQEEFAFEADPIDMTGIDTGTLFDSMMALLQKRLEKATGQVQDVTITRLETTSVRTQMALIRNRVADKGRCLFTDIFREDATRDEIIAAFLALLELMGAAEVHVIQTKSFGEIVIIKNENMDEGTDDRSK